MNRSKLGLLFVVAMVGLFSTGVALASTPTKSVGTSAASDEYAKPKPKPSVVVASKTAAVTTKAKPAAGVKSAGKLPFTGMSLLWPVVGAIGLVGLGLGIRRYERRN